MKGRYRKRYRERERERKNTDRETERNIETASEIFFIYGMSKSWVLLCISFLAVF